MIVINVICDKCELYQYLSQAEILYLDQFGIDLVCIFDEAISIIATQETYLSYEALLSCIDFHYLENQYEDYCNDNPYYPDAVSEYENIKSSYCNCVYALYSTLFQPIGYILRSNYIPFDEITTIYDTHYKDYKESVVLTFSVDISYGYSNDSYDNLSQLQ